MLACKPLKPGSIRCLKNKDFSHWKPFCAVACFTLLIDIIESWNN